MAGPRYFPSSRVSPVEPALTLPGVSNFSGVSTARRPFGARHGEPGRVPGGAGTHAPILPTNWRADQADVELLQGAPGVGGVLGAMLFSSDQWSSLRGGCRRPREAAILPEDLVEDDGVAVEILGGPEVASSIAPRGRGTRW